MAKFELSGDGIKVEINRKNVREAIGELISLLQEVQNYPAENLTIRTTNVDNSGIMLIKGFALKFGKSKENHIHPPRGYEIQLHDDMALLMGESGRVLKTFRYKFGMKGRIRISFRGNRMIIVGPDDILRDVRILR